MALRGLPDADRPKTTKAWASTERNSALRVHDIMSPALVSVLPSTPLKALSRLLVQHRLSCVPVIDDEGSLIGVVSEDDILLKQGGLLPALTARVPGVTRVHSELTLNDEPARRTETPRRTVRREQKAA